MLFWESGAMKEFFPGIVENRALLRRIGAEFFAHSFSHAYILEGPRGCGKHLLARQMAMAAACEARNDDGKPFPCGTCRACRKIAADNCLDVITVKKPEDRTTMGVETVRELRAGLKVVPNDLDVKVYIIEDAHTMTTAAQNAFLLSLEEPPAFVLFLLLTEDARALLETVRSRAPILRLQPIPHDAMREFLTASSVGISCGGAALFKERPEEFEAILQLSDGSIGKALSLLDAKKRAPLLERRALAEDLLELLAKGGAQDEIFLLLRSFGSGRDEFRQRLAMLKLALRDLVLLTRTEHAPLLFFTDREKAETLAARFTTAKLLGFVRAVEQTDEALASNANVRLSLTRLQTQLFTV